MSAASSSLADKRLAARRRESHESPRGPPFPDPIYAPNHHPDDAFRAAVAQGVAPHHWPFGPMPAQPSVDDKELEAIIAYVRDRQHAAGITHDPAH
jgi:hypothetical protein